MSAPNLLSLVEEVRAFVPTAQPTDDELAWMLNEIAWRANGRRSIGPWGLSAKASGTRIAAYRQSIDIAHDILHYAPDNELIDVFTAAGGGPASPTWSPQGPPRSADRTFVPPVPPEDEAEPPEDRPPSTDPASPSSGQQIDAVLRELAALRAEVAALAARPGELLEAEASDADLLALEGRLREELNRLAAEVIRQTTDAVVAQVGARLDKGVKFRW